MMYLFIDYIIKLTKLKMARNEEKAMSMLNRWVTQKQ